MRKAVFIHPETGCPAVFYPAAADPHAASAAVAKAIPPGQQRWSVDRKDIPTDRQYREAWTFDGKSFGVDATKKEEIDQAAVISQLESTDADMARVGEDLLDVLIQKGVISEADLPGKAAEVVSKRKNLRGQLK